jgi:transposase
MKAILACFGIRSFQPTLRKAEEKLEGLRTAEGTPLPENTRADCAATTRLRVVREQIHAIEQERLRKLAAPPAGDKGPHAMVRLIGRVQGVGVETADMLVNEILSRHPLEPGLARRQAGSWSEVVSTSPDMSCARISCPRKNR